MGYASSRARAGIAPTGTALISLYRTHHVVESHAPDECFIRALGPVIGQVDAFRLRRLY